MPPVKQIPQGRAATYGQIATLAMWTKLSEEWTLDRDIAFHTEILLEQLGDAINLILQGKMMGQTVVFF